MNIFFIFIFFKYDYSKECKILEQLQQASQSDLKGKKSRQLVQNDSGCIEEQEETDYTKSSSSYVNKSRKKSFSFSQTLSDVNNENKRTSSSTKKHFKQELLKKITNESEHYLAKYNKLNEMPGQDIHSGVETLENAQKESIMSHLNANSINAALFSSSLPSDPKATGTGSTINGIRPISSAAALLHNQQLDTLSKNSTAPVNMPLYSTLLEPIRQPQKNEKLSDKLNNNDSKLNNLNKIQLDLFNDSLDPFNDMELKTINDIEELKNILQLQQQQQQQQQSEIEPTCQQTNQCSLIKQKDQSDKYSTSTESDCFRALKAAETVNVNNNVNINKIEKTSLTPTVLTVVNNSVNTSSSTQFISDMLNQIGPTVASKTTSLNSTNSPFVEYESNNATAATCAVDNFGLPKISFIDLDINTK
jgi:hypothetical protein